ncbi:MAG TPA: hypothetical protein VGL81_07170 [Polyangiaceae bacterium]
MKAANGSTRDGRGGGMRPGASTPSTRRTTSWCTPSCVAMVPIRKCSA